MHRTQCSLDAGYRLFSAQHRLPEPLNDVPFCVLGRRQVAMKHSNSNPHITPGSTDAPKRSKTKAAAMGPQAWATRTGLASRPIRAPYP
jgi:hypothetical protein